MIRDDFPVFKNNPDLIFFDSTASSQKPSHVIDGLKEFLENDYANIHRGSYILSERSEKLYIDSKKKFANMIGAESWREVIYTMNSTYALNLLADSLRRSNKLQKGDTVIVSIVEHHANIVPWLILKEDLGINVEFVGVCDDYSLDFEDFKNKLDETVKVVSLTHVSNVTGQIFDLKKVSKLLQEIYSDTKPYFIVDSSQGFPHLHTNVSEIGCDFLFCTGHKFGADSGIGILWGKKDLLLDLKPAFSGGGAIAHVTTDEFEPAGLPDKFEPGTPNISGGVSVLRALEYVEQIGGYDKIEQIEHELTYHFLEKLKDFDGMTLLGSRDAYERVGVFTFAIDGVHSLDLADFLAEKDICIRAGRHCAEPLLNNKGMTHSCRVSLYIYNTTEEIDIFFEELEKAIQVLREV
ncbi:aminotransferase class V-fold PLP-dependent enzyme [Candidatus Gracilibacteria bacterium]|nr:aminotransferase class V-fold PLP-dependent enzyme [Candidatus Gracilibacteria bacterium]